MSEANLRRLEHRDRTQPRWSDVDIVVLDSQSDFHFKRSREAKLPIEALHNIQTMFLDLIHKHADHLTAQQLSILKQFENLFNVYDLEFLQQPSAAHNHGLEDLRTAATSAQWHDLQLEQYSRQQLTAALERCQQSQIIMTSPSHRATPELLAALTTDWDTAPRGVLSFDHHSDLEFLDSNSKSDHATKSTAMSYIAHHRLAEAIAVIGVSETFKEDLAEGPNRCLIDTVTGQSMYAATEGVDQKIPKKVLFEEHLRRIFTRWQQERNIKQVYFSVDLDGLRLDQVGYAATDYNPLDRIRTTKLRTLAEQYVVNPPQSPAELSALVKEIMNKLQPSTEDQYYGVPAAWIPQAMRLARDEFGLQLGVQNRRRERKSQNLIGDIVEYTPYDYQRRTSRIIKNLMSTMVAEVQRK